MLTSAGLNKRQTSGVSDFSYLAVGTGAQVATEPDVLSLTELDTELDRSVISTKTVVGATVSLTALFTNNQANGVLTEWGVFDAATGGNLLAYGLISPSQTKTSSQGLLLTIPDVLANG